MVLSWFLSGAFGLLLHECAHAVVGRLVGYHIREIRIGRGRILLNRRIRETTLVVGSIWSGGRVRAYPLLSGSRLAGFLFVVAGPLSNAMFLWGLLALCVCGVVPRDGFLVVFPAVLRQASVLYRALRPANVRLYGETMSNDGKRLLETLRGRNRDADTWREFYLKQLNAYWSGEGRPPRLSSASPRIVHHLYGRKKSLGQPHDRESVEALGREIARGLQPAEETFVLDALATQAICTGDTARLAELDAWSGRAVQLNPNRATLRGTRAAVLIQLGRCPEALALLPKADYSNRFNLILNRIFMAQALFREGHALVAQRHLATALSLASSAAMAGERVWQLIERTAGELGVALPENPLARDGPEESAAARPAAGCG